MTGDGIRSSTSAWIYFLSREHLEEHWILSQVAKIETSILQGEEKEGILTLKLSPAEPWHRSTAWNLNI